MRALFPHQNKIYFRLSIVFCSILCILLVLTPVASVHGQRSSKQKIEQLKKQRNQIKQEHQSTVKERKRLNNLQQEAETRLGSFEVI